jgi:hypothetical protein
MATLNNSNIVNGNTIEPNDLLQLYDAFDYAGASTKYDVTLSGSLTGNATTATTATTATSASNITTATTGSGVYYPVVVSEVGTKPPKIVSNFELSGSVLNNITASRAITASYANNSIVSQVNSQEFDNGGIQNDNFKFIAGFTAMSSTSATSSAFPGLVGKVLGITAWITANYQTGATNSDILMVTDITPTGEILFDGAGGTPTSATIIFTGIHI